MRRAIEALKVHTGRELASFNYVHESMVARVREIEQSLVIDSSEVSSFLFSDVTLYLKEVEGLMQTLSLYIDSLESYLSELDETFDQILRKANRITEKQIKEAPKETVLL